MCFLCEIFFLLYLHVKYIYIFFFSQMSLRNKFLLFCAFDNNLISWLNRFHPTTKIVRSKKICNQKITEFCSGKVFTPFFCLLGLFHSPSCRVANAILQFKKPFFEEKNKNDKTGFLVVLFFFFPQGILEVTLFRNHRSP